MMLASEPAAAAAPRPFGVRRQSCPIDLHLATG
jgi:hypothetical protein